MRRRWLHRSLLLVLAFVLAACGTPPPGEPPVLVSDDTLVLSSQQREALLEADLDSGELRFAASQQGAFPVGSVLVSEPAAAAPRGLLRRVTAERLEDDEVVLDTVLAALDEALLQGSMRAEIPLSAADVQGAQTFVQGGAIRLSGAADDDYAIVLDFDRVLLGDPSDPDNQLRLEGALKLDANFVFDVDINIFSDSTFEARVDVRELVEISITGALDQQFERELTIVNLPFTPIVIPIGPFPVVLTPELRVSIGVTGDVRVYFTTGVRQTAELSLGLRYQNGWRTIAERDFDFQTLPVVLEGSALVQGYARADFAIFLYGMLGAGIYAKGFVEADAEIGRSPFYTIDAGLEAGVSIEGRRVFSFIGRNDVVLFEVRRELSRSSNAAPSVAIVGPAGPNLDAGRAYTLGANASDREDGSACCSLSWHVGPGTSVTPSAANRVGTGTTTTYTFPGTGAYTVAAVAIDSAGASSSDARTFDVVATPPAPYLLLPPVDLRASVAYEVRYGARDDNVSSGFLTCDALALSATGGATIGAPQVRGSDCVSSVSFPSAGSATVRVDATDPYGTTGFTSQSVTILAAPTQPIPVIDTFTVSRNDAGQWTDGGAFTYVATGGAFPLAISVSASNATSYTYAYLVEPDGAAPRSGTLGISGTPATLGQAAFENVTQSTSGRFTLTVIVGNGETDVTRSITVTYQQVFN